MTTSSRRKRERQRQRAVSEGKQEVSRCCRSIKQIRAPPRHGTRTETHDPGKKKRRKRSKGRKKGKENGSKEGRKIDRRTDKRSGPGNRQSRAVGIVWCACVRSRVTTPSGPWQDGAPLSAAGGLILHALPSQPRALQPRQTGVSQI